MKKNILITGASGQLGQFFIEKLAKNNNVISTDINVSRELVKKYDLKFLDALNDEVLLTDERYASPFCIEQRGEIINEPCEPQFQQ